MSRRTTTLIGLSFTVLLLAGIGGLALSWLVHKSLPPSDATLRCAGLRDALEIYRDEAGVPHILARNEDDAYYGMGFVQAQDRLWQMDLLRRYGQGRLSELFGTRTLRIDMLMRTIGIARIADSLLVTVSPATRAILDAYCRGVNAAMSGAEGRLPAEFDMLQYTPEAWTPRDCLTVLRLIGWELALSWWTDLTLGDLIATLGEEKARQVFPSSPDDAPIIVPQPYAYAPRGGRDFIAALRSARAFLRQDGSAIGSNCWAVTRSKSARGNAILANDTHLPHMQPAPWYLMQISSPTLTVAGAGMPGMPGIAIGRNGAIAWGMTNLMADDADFSLEHINLADSTCEYRGAWERLQVRTDSIFIRDSIPVALTVFTTRHGPLIDRLHPVTERRQQRWPTEAIALRWTGAEPSDEVLAYNGVNRATSWESFRSALRSYGLPAMNFCYADRAGNIGYAAAGRIPIRSEQAATLPQPGWEGAQEWQGSVPFDRMPFLYNPPEDFIASANNPVARSFPWHLSNLWESDSRIRRILAMLRDQPTFTAGDMRYLQMDVASLHAGPVRDEFVRALLRMPDRPIELTKVMNILAHWDLRMPASSVAASLFNAALTHACEETFADEMGPDLYRNYVFLSNVPMRVFPRLLGDTATTWFDNVRTAGIETRDDILRKSVLLAMLDLTRRLGPDLTQWTWGALHRVTFRHPFGQRPPLDRMFDVGPFPIGGSTTTVNSGEFSVAEPYDCVVGPTLRMVADLGNADTLLVVLPTGQSGQPFSLHYADQTPLWLNGLYHPLIINPALYRRDRWERLELLPR